MGALAYDNRIQKSTLGLTPNGPQEGSWLDIYPIPTIDILNVEVTCNDGGELDIQIMNLLGQEVMQYTSDAAPNILKKVSLDVSGLAPGNYLVVSRIGNFIDTRKITKR
jgi:hypothetical protein